MASEVIRPYANGHSEERDTLFMLTGIAMIVFGTGLVLSNSTVRRYISQIGLGDVIHNMMPDVERYFRLRSM